MRMVLAIAMLTLGAGGVARGQEAVSRSAAENVREGNKLLDAGQYDEALSKYDAALKESPETPEIAYNRGIALYRLGKFAEAETAFQDALGGGRLDLEANAKFNLGRSAHAAAIEKKDNLPEAINDLGRAIGFYNDALQVAPKDADGVKNKEAAERLRAYLEKILAQQQQQQEKQEPTSQPNEEPTSQPQDQPQTSQPSSQPSEDQQQEGEQDQQQEGEQDQQQEGEQDQQSDQQEGDQQQDDQQKQKGQQNQQQQGDQNQDQSAEQESGEQQEKENKMSEEQAERMLQEARDAERERREAQRAKMMRMRGRIPVEKDW